MRGRDAFVVLGMMIAFWLTISTLGGDRLEEFVSGPGFYSWLVVKNVLSWAAFLGIGIYIGRLQIWNSSKV